MPRKGQFKMRVNCICERCGLAFEVKRTDFERRPCKFCSVKCYDKNGSGHPRWNGGKSTNHYGYILIQRPDHPRANCNGYVFEHIVKAEAALGKYLPPAALVHHHDENKANNENSNLVICQSHGYHKILHARMKVAGRGGDPNVDAICALCDSVKPLTDFYTSRYSINGRMSYCQPCARLMATEEFRRERRRSVA